MWSEGTISIPETGNVYKYWCKHYLEPSHFGIGGNGKISKLTIRKVNSNVDLYSYDRGEDTPPLTDEVNAVLQIILSKYN